MVSPVVSSSLASTFRPAHRVLDDLLDVDPSCYPSADLLDAWRELERLRNRLAAVEHRFVAEAERQGLPWEFGAKDTAAFVRGLLRVDPREARGRVHAADAAVGRTTLTGEPTPAPFPRVAGAQADGAISSRHARVIVSAVERLPEAIQADEGERVEAELVALARQFDPWELSKLGRRMTTLLDQDGALADVAYRERHRDLTIHRRADGSSSLTGEATAELTEYLLTVLDPLAAPKPEVDGVKDSRGAGQRCHDALLDALALVVRAEQLPSVAGITSTVLLTTTVEQWQQGAGSVTTGHGSVIPTSEAIRIAGGDARIMMVLCDEVGAVTGWTDARRLFTESQRLAMIARDGGCSFAGCDVPPAWCQAHHVIAWIDGGPTSVDNGALVCGYHHREHEKQGWRAVMIDKRPAWIPPPWIDPDQVPRVNTLHRVR